MQTLYTYYQEKTEYKKFETGDNGTFYLPEKITKGTYSLHNISAPSGYYIDKKQILQSFIPKVSKKAIIFVPKS